MCTLTKCRESIPRISRRSASCLGGWEGQERRPKTSRQHRMKVFELNLERDQGWRHPGVAEMKAGVGTELGWSLVWFHRFTPPLLFPHSALKGKQ